MSGHHSHERAYGYKCVDANPESVAGMSKNVNGALLYIIEADCDYTGHCPPYIQAAELTCVVCTR